jgi:hypothetical protein
MGAEAVRLRLAATLGFTGRKSAQTAEHFV